MTTKEFYNTIATNENLSAELREFAANAIEKMNKESASRNSKAAEKRAAENAPFVEAVTNLLRNSSKVFTAAEVKDAIEGIDSTSKATAILKMVEGVKVSEVVVNKRVVKGYSL
jgi:histidyl-tRNA synthetase